MHLTWNYKFWRNFCSGLSVLASHFLDFSLQVAWQILVSFSFFIIWWESYVMGSKNCGIKFSLLIVFSCNSCAQPIFSKKMFYWTTFCHVAVASSCHWVTQGLRINLASLFHLFFNAKILTFSLIRWPLLLIQVLCADWWKGDSVISGGADSKLCISSGISVLWGKSCYSYRNNWIMDLKL